jgi:hypothetical protein
MHVPNHQMSLSQAHLPHKSASSMSFFARVNPGCSGPKSKHVLLMCACARQTAEQNTQTCVRQPARIDRKNHKTRQAVTLLSSVLLFPYALAFQKLVRVCESSNPCQATHEKARETEVFCAVVLAPAPHQLGISKLIGRVLLAHCTIGVS